MPVSLEVTFAAYLAVLLGTFFPVVFLVTLYFQSESRKAGIKDGSKGLN
jgi:photosystem II reaction center protein PsbM